MFKYVTVGLIGLGACHAPTKPAPTVAILPPALRIVAADYAFDSVADTVAAGARIITLVNHGHQAHMAVLVRMDSAHSAADFMRELLAGGKLEWATSYAGPNLALPGDSTTVQVQLPPGHYAITCWVLDSAGAPHVNIGMIRSLDVMASGTADQPESVTDDTVRLSSYRLDLSHPLVAGAHVLRVENVDSGSVEHDVVVIHILPGHTLAEAETWLDSFHGAPASFDVAGGVTGLTRGQHAELFATLQPGSYAILCLMPDGADNKAHYRHGMVSAFTVN